MYLPNLVQISQTGTQMLSFIAFQNGGSPPSWICCTRALDHPQRVLVGPHHRATFAWNRSSENSQVLMLCEFGLKMSIRALLRSF